MPTGGSICWRARSGPKLVILQNVETKNRHALDDIAATQFPSETARLEALTAAYDHIAWAAMRADQYAMAIVFTHAAIANGGDAELWRHVRLCRAYVKLETVSRGDRSLRAGGHRSAAVRSRWTGAPAPRRGRQRRRCRDAR